MISADNTFFKIRKRDLKKMLREKGIRPMHHDRICAIFKSNILIYLDDHLVQSAEEYYHTEGFEDLKRFIKHEHVLDTYSKSGDMCCSGCGMTEKSLRGDIAWG